MAFNVLLTIFLLFFQARERFPRIAAEALRGPCHKHALDEEDLDPYVVGNKHKMGRTHTSRPGNFSAAASGSDDEITVLEVFYFFASLYTVFL